jgi:hypothetical protein
MVDKLKCVNYYHYVIQYYNCTTTCTILQEVYYFLFALTEIVTGKNVDQNDDIFLVRFIPMQNMRDKDERVPKKSTSE